MQSILILKGKNKIYINIHISKVSVLVSHNTLEILEIYLLKPVDWADRKSRGEKGRKEEKRRRKRETRKRK